jgi:hypothetical protein
MLEQDAAMLRREDLYQALFDDDAFQALPGALAASLRGRSSIIHWVHSDGEIAVAAHSYFTAEYMDAYSRTYVNKDLWVNSALHPKRRNRVFTPSMTR